jgi:hypothetical protein
MYNYFRSFIKNFSSITKPITELLKNRSKNKKEPIQWLPEHQKAFDELKKTITQPPVLQLFEPTRKIIVECDASGTALSGILSQIDPETGLKHPVSYYSSTLKDTKKGRASYDIELEAVCRTFTAFRPYLALTHFTLLCDNKAVVHQSIKGKTFNARRISKINDIINQFSFDIEHISSSKNVLADYLSRATYKETINNTNITVTPPIDDYSNDEFIQEQEKDKNLKAIRNLILERKPSPSDFSPYERKHLYRQSRRFNINKEGILCYTKFNRGQRLSLIAVPKHLTSKIIQLVHETVGNHFGFPKTYLQLQNKFYFENMYRQVKNYTQSCHFCQQNKRSYEKLGHLSERKLDHDKPYVFQHISIDSLGPYTFSPTQKWHVMATIDKATKFLVLRAYQTINSHNVIHFLTNLITTYPMPYRLLSDNHPTFKSDAVRNFLEKYNIKPVYSPPYSAHCNGEIERQMANINLSILAKLAEKHSPSSLPSIVKFIAQAHNCSSHPLLPNKCSPFFLLYGFEANLLERQLNIHHQPSPSREKEIQRLNLFRESIPKILHANFECYSKYYNAKHKNKEFNIGDKVLVKKIQANKLDTKFYGPQLIIKKLSPTVYILQDDDKEEYLTHIEYLKPYFTRE